MQKVYTMSRRKALKIEKNKKTMSVRGWLKMLGIAFGSIIGVCIIIFLVLWSWSPGKITPYKDKDGNILAESISEITKVKIGGMEQGMIIKGRNKNNPVLLFLHGGPGNPEYVLAKNYPIGLEDYFTVCWWEQRGGGMSYSSSISSSTMTLEQMVEDTVEVTNYLKERFGKDKIYLMGHSWGSFLGVNTVAQYPELYEAYMGIGQVSNQLESEKLGYMQMLSTAKENGDEKSIKMLMQYKLDGANTITPNYLMVRSNIMSKQGNGVFHIAKSKFSLLLPIFQAKEYTLSNKYGYAVGSMFCLEQPLNKSQFTTNLMEEITELKVPIYIFHGAYDRQVSYELSKEYLELLKAPKKQFYTFDNSAHSPFMEEPVKFMQIIKNDILGIDEN